jgi:hypothetical protein
MHDIQQLQSTAYSAQGAAAAVQRAMRQSGCTKRVDDVFVEVESTDIVLRASMELKHLGEVLYSSYSTSQLGYGSSKRLRSVHSLVPGFAERVHREKYDEFTRTGRKVFMNRLNVSFCVDSDGLLRMCKVYVKVMHVGTSLLSTVAMVRLMDLG